jgi:hypothetical protein
VVATLEGGFRATVGMPQAYKTVSSASCRRRLSGVLASRIRHSFRWDGGRSRIGVTTELAISNACGCFGSISQTTERARRPEAIWDSRRAAAEFHSSRIEWVAARSSLWSPTEAGLRRGGRCRFRCLRWHQVKPSESGSPRPSRQHSPTLFTASSWQAASLRTILRLESDSSDDGVKVCRVCKGRNEVE